MRNLAGLLSTILAMVLLAFPALAERTVSPFVWQATDGKWLRDPSVFRTDSGSYILSGTNNDIVEYPAQTNGILQSDQGTAYQFRIFSANGKRNLRRNDFIEWEKNFFSSADGLVMIASLPTVENFDLDAKAEATKRSIFDFEPKPGGRTTALGFPLDWQLRDDEPLLASTYNGDIFDTGGNKVLLYPDVRNDQKYNTTCIMVLPMTRQMALGESDFLLCPGRKVKRSKDASGWNRDKPLPSEVRFKDGGGLVEGAWLYASPNGKTYVLYSSGAFRSDDLYGGFVAECDSPAKGCRKTMQADNADARAFVQGSSANYYQVGRPFPVVDPSGNLVDIIFHARRRGHRESDILRCLNFTPTILEDFVQGGPGCAYDNIKF